MHRLSLPILCVGLLLLGHHDATANEWEVGSTHVLSFSDVDGKEISTADGRVTIITVVTRAHEENARAVADLVPDRYIGDQKYRYVTMVNFQDKLAGPFQGLTRAVIRNRLNAEAEKLKPQYREQKIGHDPRRRSLCDRGFRRQREQTSRPYGAQSRPAVFVFDGAGRLLARWEGIPPGDALPNILAKSG